MGYAAMESFFKTFKVERIHEGCYGTREEATLESWTGLKASTIDNAFTFTPPLATVPRVV
jgi:hypothetical protein